MLKKGGEGGVAAQSPRGAFKAAAACSAGGKGKRPTLPTLFSLLLLAGWNVSASSAGGGERGTGRQAGGRLFERRARRQACKKTRGPSAALFSLLHALGGPAFFFCASATQRPETNKIRGGGREGRGSAGGACSTMTHRCCPFPPPSSSTGAAAANPQTARPIAPAARLAAPDGGRAGGGGGEGRPVAMARRPDTLAIRAARPVKSLAPAFKTKHATPLPPWLAPPGWATNVCGGSIPAGVAKGGGAQ